MYYCIILYKCAVVQIVCILRKANTEQSFQIGTYFFFESNETSSDQL